jgi:hypothetical protein
MRSWIVNGLVSGGRLLQLTHTDVNYASMRKPCHSCRRLPVSGILGFFGPGGTVRPCPALAWGSAGGQSAELLDLFAELADLLNQRWQVRMVGCPLLVAGCFLGEQFLSRSRRDAARS